MDTPPPLSPASVLTLISHLVRRPARTDHRLPLIWLSGRQGGTHVLDTLFDRLTRTPRYRVPYVRVTASREDAPSDIRPLLHTLCVELAAPRFGGERPQFRHYELGEWLMTQNLAELGPGDRARTITRLLRRRHRPPRTEDDGHQGNASDQDVTRSLEPRYRFLVWLIRRVAPEVLFRAAVSGRIPGVGRRYRWFMRQQYLAPLQSVNFLGFAERLTEGARQREDTDQVDKLLVHAFLEDLRQAHARRPWRLEGWRRTAYPVVLIDNAAPHTDGYRLLQRINDVRNETGRSDPLLVVCTSDQVPRASISATGGLVVEPGRRELRNSDPLYDDDVYRKWSEALPGSRRARVDTAWYLPISVAGPDESEATPGLPIGRRKPPWFTRRAVVVVVVLGLIGALLGWASYEHGGIDCPYRPFSGQVKVHSIGSQCIGYSDSAAFRFNDEPGQEKLRYIQNKIFEQNRKVREFWESGNRARPYVTIVYLGSLTGRQATENEEAYAAERQELEGLAVAQYEGLQDPASLHDSPLLHIVIANGGFQMEFAEHTVEMIAKLAAEDPTVMAVTGLVESRDSTASALRKLNEIGLPAIAPTLSADKFHENSRLYLQLSAPNMDQARMLGYYSKDVLKVSKARIYWTIGKDSVYEGQDSIYQGDLYVKTLVESLSEVLPREFGINIDSSERFDGLLGRDECGYEGLLFFAGRWTEFSEFLRELGNNCAGNQPSHLVGNDSVGRYMANPALRKNAPSSISVTFVSKSTLGSCKNLQAATKGDDVRDKFYRWIQEPELLDPPRCGGGNQNEPVGERIPLAYDSAKLLLQAVEDLANKLRFDERQEWDPRLISPLALYVAMLHPNPGTPFRGVAGDITLDPNSGEPIGKQISLLRVESVPNSSVEPEEVFQCNIIQANGDPCRQP